MSGRNPRNEPPDRELEEYLAGGSPLSRHYAALAREEPPADLDRRIREAAADSAEDSLLLRIRRLRHWTVPAAVAATVLLAVGVVIRMPGERALPAKLPAAAERGPVAGDARRREAAPGTAAGQRDDDAGRPDRAAAAPPADEADRTGRGPGDAPAPGAGPGDRAEHSIERVRPRGPDRAPTTYPAYEASVPPAAREPPAAPSPPQASSRPQPAMPDMELYDGLDEGPLEGLSSSHRALPPRAGLSAGDAAAARWLLAIAMLYDDGDHELAREELGRFFQLYPDYELPEGFPLTRADAEPPD